jgi:cytochrome c oxidase subunit 2
MLSFLNFLVYSSTINAFCDAPEQWQFGFQDPATPMAQGMISFHHYLMYILIIIGVAVFYLLYRTIELFQLSANSKPQTFTHSPVLEIVWTIIPAIILLFIAAPSFSLLYSLDETIDPDMTLKIIGHQWYWSYEYSDPIVDEETGDINYHDGIAYDSYLVEEADLALGQLRLLEVDNRVCLPVNRHIRLLVTSADVLHSWAVPSFGIKVDACPGRLSQASLFVLRTGTYYGQCSEICGANHGFMPIAVNVREPDQFVNWMKLALEDE